MVSDEVLIELTAISCEPWGSSSWYRASPPTPTSLRRVFEELHVPILTLFADIATRCPAYGGWFASIGEDYESHIHILGLNRTFRKMGLPPEFVMLNHGHDGDCDCWDTAATGSDEELPIVYVYLPNGGKAEIGEQLGASFRDYVWQYCQWSAPRSPVRRLRRRAKRILVAEREATEQCTPVYAQ